MRRRHRVDTVLWMIKSGLLSIEQFGNCGILELKSTVGHFQWNKQALDWKNL